MNFYEREIAKYQRRIERIQANPDPRYLKSNAALYQITLDYTRGELEAWQKGKPFVHNEMANGLVIQAMGLHEVNVSPLADRAVARSKEYFEIARKAGVPDTVCDRLQVGIGICISGDVPPPRFVVGGAGVCDPMTLACHFLADYFNVPMYAIETPTEHSYESIKYMRAQYEEMVAAIEKTIPGIKFDEAKLRKLQEYEIAMHDIIRETYQMKSATPCPLSGKDVLRLPRTRWGDPEANLAYVKQYRDEIAEKVKSGRTGVEEKLRFAWLITAPFYFDVWTFLEEKGVSVPYFEFGRAAPAFLGGAGNPGDDSEFGRHLEPLEEAARMALSNTWAGPTDVRYNGILTAVKMLNIDALVHFMQSGCPPNVANARIIGEKLEKELGIPSLYIDGWCLDEEKFNEEELLNALDSFIDICMERKYGLVKH